MNNGNQDLKEYFKKKRVFQWEVADIFGYSEAGFARRLRDEFPDNIKEQIKQCIDDYLQNKTPNTKFFHDYIKSISKSKIKQTRKQKLKNYDKDVIKDILYYEELNRNSY